MKKANCIFCSIAAGEVPSYKIYEDKDYVAFLDLFPIAKGQVLVIPKTHTTSRFHEADDRVLEGLMLTIKRAAGMMVKGLPAKRVVVLIEGFEVDHLHAKLYPDKGLAHTGKKASDGELEDSRRRILAGG